MFEQMKMMGALASLMKNKEGLKAAGERLRTRLSEIRAGGAAGGGAVRATATGDMKIASIQIEPALAAGLTDQGNRALAERLIAEAVNNALDQAKVIAQREAAKEAEALGLPGMDDLVGALGS